MLSGKCCIEYSNETLLLFGVDKMEEKLEFMDDIQKIIDKTIEEQELTKEDIEESLDYIRR